MARGQGQGRRRQDDEFDLEGNDDSGQTYGTDEGNSGNPNRRLGGNKSRSNMGGSRMNRGGGSDSRGRPGGTGKRFFEQLSHEELQELGRQGGLAKGRHSGSQGRSQQGRSRGGGSRGEDWEEEEDFDEEGDGRRNNGPGGLNEQRHRGGGQRRNLQGRGRRGSGSMEDEGEEFEGETHMQGGTHEQHVRAGKLGAQARWGHDYLHEDNESYSENEDMNEEENEGDFGGRGNRGQGQRRNRGGSDSRGRPGGTGKRFFEQLSHEELQELGRQGGLASGRHRHGGQGGSRQGSRQGSPGKRSRSLMQDNNEEDWDNEGYSDEDMGVDKDPGRVRAGKKAARTRGHAEMAEMGRKGGLSRRGTTNLGNETREELYSSRRANAAY